MTESTSPMHSETASKPLRPCDQCGTGFAPKRSWARFCGKACHNAFHAAEVRDRKIRAAAQDLYEALLDARAVMRGRDLEHVWINHPQKPELTLGAKIDRALAKAGYKPTPTHPVIKACADTIQQVNAAADRRDAMVQGRD